MRTLVVMMAITATVSISNAEQPKGPAVIDFNSLGLLESVSDFNSAGGQQESGAVVDFNALSSEKDPAVVDFNALSMNKDPAVVDFNALSMNEKPAVVDFNNLGLEQAVTDFTAVNPVEVQKPESKEIDFVSATVDK